MTIPHFATYSDFWPWHICFCESKGLRGICDGSVEVMNDAASQLYGEFRKLLLSCKTVFSAARNLDEKIIGEIMIEDEVKHSMNVWRFRDSAWQKSRKLLVALPRLYIRIYFNVFNPCLDWLAILLQFGSLATWEGQLNNKYGSRTVGWWLGSASWFAKWWHLRM